MARLLQGVTKKANGRYRGRFTFHSKSYELNQRKDETLTDFQNRFRDYRYRVENNLFDDDTSSGYNDLKLGEWFQIYMTEYKCHDNVKTSTINQYWEVYHSAIEPTFSNVRLDDLHPVLLQKYFNSLSSLYSQSRIKSIFTVMNQALRKAFCLDMIPQNPLDKVDIPKSEKPKKVKAVLTVDQQRLFLKYASKYQIYPVLLFALLTGLRIGEIAALQWGDIDFESKLIHVNQTLYYDRSLKKWFASSPKNGRTRIVPMVDPVVSLLHMQRKTHLENKLKSQDEYNSENLVFANRSGHNIYNSNVDTVLNVIVQNIRKDDPDFPHLSCHCLRHSFATNAYQSGVDIKALQQVLGHSTIKMTMDTYVKAQTETIVKAFEKMEIVV